MHGINILQVNMVVNYDLPLMNKHVKGADEHPDIKTYIHCIGRTVHFGCRASAWKGGSVCGLIAAVIQFGNEFPQSAFDSSCYPIWQ